MFRKIIAVFVICVMTSAIAMQAVAVENAAGVSYSDAPYAVLDAQDHGSFDEMENDVNALLESYDNTKVINADSPDILSEKGADIVACDLSNIEPKANGSYLYDVRNVRAISNSFGSDYLNVSGSPGVTIGLSHAETEKYSIDFTSTFGCPSGAVATAAWGTTKEKELTYFGTWKVPSKHNGKNVKRGRLHMRPEFKRKKCDIYRKVHGYTDWSKIGATVTKRAYSVDIYKTFVYM